MENKDFKSQVCTSIDQSRRLLELGLKKETADMVYFQHWQNATQKKHDVDVLDTTNLPAWSLHRLIEMMPENITSDDWFGVSFDEVSYYHGAGEGLIGLKYYKVGNLYDCIIECYEWLIKEGYFNKEYLEDKK